jgi:hypothetical protein
MSSIDGSEDEPMPNPVQCGRKRGRKLGSHLPISLVGQFVIFCVIASNSGVQWWPAVFEHDYADVYLDGRVRNFVGLALVRCSLVSGPMQDPNPQIQALRKASLKGKRSHHELLGFLRWDMRNLPTFISRFPHQEGGFGFELDTITTGTTH